MSIMDFKCTGIVSRRLQFFFQQIPWALLSSFGGLSICMYTLPRGDSAVEVPSHGHHLFHLSFLLLRYCIASILCMHATDGCGKSLWEIVDLHQIMPGSSESLLIEKIF